MGLNSFDLTLQVLELCSSAVIGVSFGDRLFPEAASLEILLVKQTLGSCQFVTQVKALLGPVKHMQNQHFILR